MSDGTYADIRRAAVADGHARGWSYTPLDGKRPIERGWQKAPRESAEQAAAWASAGNVGVRTGRLSGVYVIDLDTRKPDYDAAAVASLGLPRTATVRTGSGGLHLYYRHPDGMDLGNSANKLAPAVDTRGDGGQVVAVGSVHPDTGKPYVWAPNLSPDDVGIADLPADIIDRLQAAKHAPENRPPLPTGRPSSRADTSEYGRAALAAECADLAAMAANTGRNNALNVAACKLGSLVAGGVLSRGDVDAELYNAAAACGLVADDGEASVRATITSGLQTGMKSPRQPLPQNPPGRPPANARRGTAGRPHSGPPADGGGSVHDADGCVRLGERCPDTGRLVLSTKRTLPTATAYVREFATRDGVRTVHSYAGRLLTWRDNCYGEIEEGAIRNGLQPWLHDAVHYVGAKDGPELQPFPANPSTVTAAVETVRAAVHLDADRDVPFWLSGRNDVDAREILPCKTVNLHIPTGSVTPSTPDLFTFNSLSFDYRRDAPKATAWLDFLESLWPDDPDSIALLQQWAGYCLTADTSQQKMLLMIGPKRSGKGTVGRVLTELIGRGNVVGPTTESLADTFGLQQLLGKSLAIVSDARFGGSNMQTVVERLLCISGEDRLTIRRMYKDHVTQRLPIRFVFLTNETPILRDSAGALAGRFLTLKLKKSFFGKEDTTLTQRLLDELPGILLWALQGWHALRTAGRFREPESSREVSEQMADLSSPVSAFVRECCDMKPGYRVTPAELYAAWREWCEASGRGRVTTIQTFGKDISAAFPEIECRRNHTIGRFYDGLSLKSQLSAPLGGEE